MTDAPESQVSGRGALAELKEAVTGLVEQVANLVPGRGIFLDPFPRHELQVVDDGFHAWVELPGMKREEVEVAVAGRILTVSGERQLAGAPDGARKLKSERRGGEFELRIELPDGVDPLGVIARLDEGVLSIQLPKYKDARGRNIKVDQAAPKRTGAKRKSTSQKATASKSRAGKSSSKRASPSDKDDASTAEKEAES